MCFRLCSLAQDAKQEAEDSTVGKEIIKPDPATGEEEQQEETEVKVPVSREEEEAHVAADSSSGPSRFLISVFCSSAAQFSCFCTNLNILVMRHYICVFLSRISRCWMQI